MNLPRIALHDVVARDGFQSYRNFIHSTDKIALLNALSATGLDKLEVTSFVSPKAVPMLADAETVMRGIQRLPGVCYAALIANAKGAERALACDADEVNVVISASESHNQHNVHRSTRESFAGVRDIQRVLHGSRTRLAGSLSTSFGCPYEGRVPLERVLACIEEYQQLGVDSIVLADTTGMANPRQVGELCAQITHRWPGYPFTLHFHNTRGMGLANVLTGLQHHITRFEGSLGGLGGCPFAPGATGNICTEDTVHMLQAMGLAQHIHLERLLACAQQLQTLVAEPLPGQIMKAGPILG